jgi:hypothetical protein
MAHVNRWIAIWVIFDIVDNPEGITEAPLFL